MHFLPGAFNRFLTLSASCYKQAVSLFGIRYRDIEIALVAGSG